MNMELYWPNYKRIFYR